jgi:tripartite ATP-independent transporter DctM subunit
MTLPLSLGILLLALFGVPLFIVIGAFTLLFYKTSGSAPAGMFIELYSIATFPTLIAIPLFTFAGYMLAESNSPKRIINLTSALFGWMPGGLAIVSLCACAFFTAFSGASGVTIIALGGLLFPMLIKDQYREKFSLGLLTTSGSLGLLFPPSLPIILYAMIAKTSLDSMFLAGILPGLLLLILLSLFSVYKNKDLRQNQTPFSPKTVLSALKGALWEIPIPLIVIIGIYGGFITPTEASAVIAVYVFIIEVFFYRDLNLTQDIPRIMRESMMLVGSILVIMGLALGLTGYLTDESIPQKILAFMQHYLTNKVTFLIVLNIFLLIVGCLMDIFSAIFVVVPLILPIAAQFGVDPVHLGIIFLTNLEIGYSTPPVGLNLFIASYRFEKSIVHLYQAAVPFIIIMLIALLIITYVPQLSLLLLHLFGKG